MSTRTLVYKEASVDAMAKDLSELHTSLKEKLDALFVAVDGDLTGWSEATESRQAERQYQKDLKDSIAKVLDGLEKLKSGLEDAKDLADTAETRNIAVLA